MTVNLNQLDNSNNEENKKTINTQDELGRMMEENLKLTKEIYEMTRKIKRYIAFQRVVSFIYILLIVVPIILSIIYLPPLLKSMLGPYQELLGIENTSGFNFGDINLDNIDLNKLSPELLKSLQK